MVHHGLNATVLGIDLLIVGPWVLPSMNTSVIVLLL